MGGAAQANVYINDSALVGALTIVTGAGNDFVAFDTGPNSSTSKSSFYGAVIVNLGLGDDAWVSDADPSLANLGNYFNTSVKIDGGGGTDEVQNIYTIGGNSSNFLASSAPVLVSIEKEF